VAIRLNDITSKTKERKEQAQLIDKERVLRPWETFEKLGAQTRTIGAREAVKSAREKVKSNNELVDRLRDGFVEMEKARNWDDEVNDKQIKLDSDIKDLSSTLKKINTKPGVISFFKEMFKAQ